MTKTYELKEPIIIDTDDYTIEQIDLIKKVLTVIKLPKGTKIEYS